jgi:hypothetical protein
MASMSGGRLCIAATHSKLNIPAKLHKKQALYQ